MTSYLIINDFFRAYPAVLYQINGQKYIHFYEASSHIDNINIILANNTITKENKLKMMEFFDIIDSDISYEESLYLARYAPDLIKLIDNQTDELIMTAFDSAEYICSLIPHVKNMTDELYTHAAKINPWYLKFVKNQTEELCIECVTKEPATLQFVNNQTEEVAKSSIQSGPMSYDFVKWNDSLVEFVKTVNPEYEKYSTFKSNIKLDNVFIFRYNNIKYAKCENDCYVESDIQKMFRKYSIDKSEQNDIVNAFESLNVNIKDWNLYNVIKNVNDYVGITNHQSNWSHLWSVSFNPMSIQYLENPTNEIIIKAVSVNGFAIRYIKEPTSNQCITAMTQNGEALRVIKRQTKKICLAAVKEYGLSLEFVKKKSHRICSEAVKQTPDAIVYVKNKTKEILDLI